MEAKEAYNSNSNSYNLNQDSEQVPMKSTPDSSQNSPAKTLPMDARHEDRNGDSPFSDLNEKTVKPPDIDLKVIYSNQDPKMSIRGNSVLSVPISSQPNNQQHKPGESKRGLPRPEAILQYETAKSQKLVETKPRQAVKRPEDQSGLDIRKKQVYAAATFTSKYTKVVSQVLTDRCREGAGTIGKQFYERIKERPADKNKTETATPAPAIDIEKEGVDDYLFMDEPQIPLLEAFEYLQLHDIDSRDDRSQFFRNDFIKPEGQCQSISVDISHSLYMTCGKDVIYCSTVVNNDSMARIQMATDNFIVCLMTVSGKLVALESTMHVKQEFDNPGYSYSFTDTHTKTKHATSTYCVSVYDTRDNYRLVMTKDVSVLMNDMTARDVYDFAMNHTYCQYTTTSIALIKSRTATPRITCMVIDVGATVAVDPVVV